MSEKEISGVDRRTLIKSAGAVALGIASHAYSAAPRRRFAHVGLGSRARMYMTAITGKFRDGNELVAICDSNEGRAALAAKTVAATGASKPQAYKAADFDRMIRETKPQTVIVTTPDASHSEYIIRALD